MYIQANPVVDIRANKDGVCPDCCTLRYMLEHTRDDLAHAYDSWTEEVDKLEQENLNLRLEVEVKQDRIEWLELRDRLDPK